MEILVRDFVHSKIQRTNRHYEIQAVVLFKCPVNVPSICKHPFFEQEQRDLKHKFRSNLNLRLLLFLVCYHKDVDVILLNEERKINCPAVGVLVKIDFQKLPRIAQAKR
jgi:hypothetical protein